MDSAPSSSSVPDSVTALADRLVARARAGDMQAWSRLYHQQFDTVYRHVRYLTGDGDAAEDLTQETFAQALVSLASFRGESTFATWLHHVAVNVVRKHWRWQRNTSTAHERYGVARSLDRREDPGKSMQRNAKAEVLYAILGEMPTTLREVFVLRDLQGFSQKEIAERLQISESNAAVRATRARAHVRGELERLGWLEPEGT